MADVKINVTADTKDAKKDIAALGETVGETGEGFKIAGLSLTDFKSGMEIAGKAVEMVGQVLDQTVGAVLEYSDQVRDLSRVSGASAEDTSRLIQVADDLQVEYTSLQQAAKALAKEGIALTTEELAKASDEYLAITDAGARAEFAVTKFGRSGLELTKILEQGGDALRQMAAGQDQNLVMTEKQVKAARDLEIAQDNLEDSIMGLKLAFGNVLIPVLNDAITAVDLLINKQSKLYDIFTQHEGDMKKTAKSYEEYRTEMERAASVAGLLVDENGNLYKSITGGGVVVRDYTNGLKIMTQAEYDDARSKAASKLAADTSKSAIDNLAVSVGTYQRDLALGVISQNNLNNALEVSNSLAANSSVVMQAYTTQLLYNQAAAGLDKDASLLLAGALGLIDTTTLTAMGRLDELRKMKDAGKLSALEYANAVRELNNAIQALKDKTVTVTVNNVTHGSNGGYYDPGTGSGYGGGGGAGNSGDNNGGQGQTGPGHAESYGGIQSVGGINAMLSKAELVNALVNAIQISGIAK